MAQLDYPVHTTHGEDTVELDVTVVALLPEFRQAKAQSAEGYLVAITDATKGVHLATLREGQRLRCTVTRRLPRVVRAELLR